MNATGTITMTMREVDRFKVIEVVAEYRLKPGQAAERLELTTRQVRRLVARLAACVFSAKEATRVHAAGGRAPEHILLDPRDARRPPIRVMLPHERPCEIPEKEVDEDVPSRRDGRNLFATFGRNLRRAVAVGVVGVHVAGQREQLDAGQRLGVGREHERRAPFMVALRGIAAPIERIHSARASPPVHRCIAAAIFNGVRPKRSAVSGTPGATSWRNRGSAVWRLSVCESKNE